MGNNPITNAKSQLFICATAQASVLNQAAFEVLTWVEVGGVGSVGEVGSDTNIVTKDTWSDDVLFKAKGNTNAGDPDIECVRLPTDPGQIILRAAAADPVGAYALKIVRTDKATGGGDGTTIYNRGLITGPKRPMGRAEDFDLETYKAGMIQKEIVVDPT